MALAHAESVLAILAAHERRRAARERRFAEREGLFGRAHATMNDSARIIEACEATLDRVRSLAVGD